MKRFLLFLYLIIYIYKCENNIYSHSNNENNLYFVLTSFRHGARETLVKQDYFNNKIKYSGKLTTYGAKQHLIIGKKYRERYFNFLNLNNKIFNKDQIYIRTSDIPRTVISTKKQLEGLFNTIIDDNNIDFVNVGKQPMRLYYLNMSEINIIQNYFQLCKLRKLNEKKKNYKKYFDKKILPIFQKCFKDIKNIKIELFCDNTFSAFFDYKYNKRKKNNIGKCGYKTAKIFYDYCNKYFDSKRGWNEISAYIFNIFFKTIFKYMRDSIENANQLKMIMLGGHDTTLAPLMNFFNGLNIIKRTEYPHYAYNIVLELRIYNKEMYLEIYYNDILKYNKTLKAFENILNNSKYSNLYNFCGFL